MKTRKLIFGFVAMLAGVLCMTSCQDEEELADRLLEESCWEGSLPIREHHGNEIEYSRFFFYWKNGAGTGIEDVYRDGEYAKTYNFKWYWLDEGWRTLALNYGGRHNEDISCIRIRKIKNWLYGWYYASLDDWYLDRDANQTTRGHAIELHATDELPYGTPIVVETDTTKTDDGNRTRSQVFELEMFK